jgi:glutamate synthase (NADPH/NADH) large chain
MVDLDPLDASDTILLQKMLTAHYDKTGSAVAKFILADFEQQTKHFIKVFPRDYKNIVEKNRQINYGKANRI